MKSNEKGKVRPEIRPYNAAAGPLAGLRVIQFGGDLAPQMVGLALSDLGADVVRCGTAADDPLSAVLDRGKRIAAIGSDMAALYRLAGSADVLIGADQAPLAITAALPPTALALSLPAFPTNDPRFVNRDAHEGSVLAAAGVLAERGPSNRLRGLGPAIVPMPIASAYAAAFGTLAVTAGVFGRQQTGRGDSIEVSLFAALMEGFSYNHFKITDLPQRYIDPRNSVDTVDLPVPESRVQELIDPMYRAFLCADDVWFYIATPPHRGIIERMLRLFGLWEGLLSDGLPTDNPYLSTRVWKDPLEGSIFAYPQLAPHWRDRVRTGIERVVRTQPVAYWEEQFAAHGLCGSRVQSSADWLASSQARSAGHAIEFVDPLAGRMTCAGPFMWTDRYEAPKPREVVRATELAWRGEAWGLPQVKETKPFLSGVRVLDLCNVIAGPTVAGCLTRFGAEVIKIDPTRQAFDPSITVLLSLQSARGKESILLDLSTDEGKAIFARIAASADLVTFNGTRSQMVELGLTIDNLARYNPAITVAQVSAFGGPLNAPVGDLKGVDEVLQAATGVMHRLKPSDAPPEEYAHYGTIDVATGVWGAVAAVAGMVAANRTGSGRQVGTSLAAGAAAVQIPYLWSSQAMGQAPDPLGTTANAALAGKIDAGMYVSPSGNREPLARYADLRSRFALAETDDAHKVGFVRHADHPAGTTVELVTQCAIRCEEAPLVTVGNPHKYGSRTRAVLEQFGFSPREIDSAFSSGAAAESWPGNDHYLPD
ncbi:CoA transferase [Ensifer adhaerens]|uniref:CoA transferase n=1 Tax=Ensifer adhaerens TaxID=106592 RepID=UPI001C4DE165|nr:CoA transferase [Ensifer adhaerens]MBW0370817.1 CoA transferase [Ensifer adhaerens]UCM24275.1 CoA transferase [Ensifer adhaerens]